MEEDRGPPNFAMEVDGARNDEWLEHLRRARRYGCVHAGWVSFHAQAERRMLDHTPADEEEFMERYGYVEYYTHWERALPAKHWVHWGGGEIDASGQVVPGTGDGTWVDRPSAWQEALLQLGLVNVGGVALSIGGRGGRLARHEARAILIGLLTRHAYGNSGMMDEDTAGAWADAFLAPVGPETPLYTGAADTATMNSGVVFILGDPSGGEGSSVGCLWCGDED
jgi:hypothetical protein